MLYYKYYYKLLIKRGVKARLRCYCLTDDRIDRTLERLQRFQLVALSPEIEARQPPLLFTHHLISFSSLLISLSLLAFVYFFVMLY